LYINLKEDIDDEIEPTSTDPNAAAVPSKPKKKKKKKPKTPPAGAEVSNRDDTNPKVDAPAVGSDVKGVKANEGEDEDDEDGTSTATGASEGPKKKKNKKKKNKGSGVTVLDGVGAPLGVVAPSNGNSPKKTVAPKLQQTTPPTIAIIDLMPNGGNFCFYITISMYLLKKSKYGKLFEQ